MLLTLSQPSHTDFGSRGIHEFRSPSTVARYSPKIMNDPVRTSTLPASITPTMSTHHRGLPPPPGMTLPDPGRPPPPPPPPQIPPNLNHPLGSLPEQPRYQGGAGGIGVGGGGGSGSESDSMRNWLATKAEEEKRKQEEERRRQEEEKTRQQSLKLEQRRIEHAMLQDSLHGQIPPHMVPMIFAGIGGANIANFSLEVLQQWQQQMVAAQQQLQQHESSPELRRETRSIHQGPAGYPTQQHQVPPPPIVPPPPGLTMQQPPPPPPPPMTGQQTTFSAYHPHGQQPSPPQPRMQQQQQQQQQHHSRAAAHSALPRLTTGDMQIQAPPTAPSSAHPLHQTQTINQEQPASSPIYFHHWVPPTSHTDKANAPQTPVTGPGTSHLSEGDYSQSPRKRKNQAPHQPNPPPSGSLSQNTSPQFSHQSSSGGKKPAAPVHGRSTSKSSKDGENSSHRATPSRRDSGAPHHGSQADFVVNVAGGPPGPDPRRHQEQSSRQAMSSRGASNHPQYSPHQQQQQQQHHHHHQQQQQQQQQHQSHHSQTAPSSPKREYR